MAASEVLHPQLFSGFGRPKAAAPAAEPSASSGPSPGPGQLPMFMSAREITSQYEPNMPDRLFHGTNVSVGAARGVRFGAGTDPRAGDWTGRDARTDGVINNFEPDTRGNYHPRRPLGVPLKGEWAKPETDEQLYDRKYQEARMPLPSGRTTTFSSIALEGVHNPVALGHEEGTGRPDFVAGGHHRIAVMRNLNPDQLMPVMHVKSVGEAQGMGL